MKKKLIIGLLSFVGLFFLFLVWFKVSYSMDKVEGFDKGSYNASQKVLIATQGSEYKNGVVDDVLEYLSSDDIYVKVIDVSSLKDITADQWDAILILHVWEIWKPEPNTAEFINKHYDKAKMFVVCTSGSGDEMMDGVEGITGASDLTQINSDSKKIADWLYKTLQ